MSIGFSALNALSNEREMWKSEKKEAFEEKGVIVRKAKGRMYNTRYFVELPDGNHAALKA